MTIDPLWLAQTGLAALGDIAFACVLGALLLDVWLVREQAFAPFAAGSPARRGAQRAVRFASVCAMLLAFCNLASLWLQSAAMSGLPLMQAGDSLWLVATATHAGIGWSIAFVGSVLLVLATVSRGALRALAIGGAIVAASGKAAIGHAADAGAFSIPEAVQTVHVLATGVWGGVVIAGALAVLPTLMASITRATLIQTITRMSHSAMIAIALVLVTGTFNGWRGTGGSLAVMTSSTWGHALAVKLALVATALVLGSMNRWKALPRLHRSASTTDAHTVIKLMRIEAVAMLGVFVAAAVLSHAVPGMATIG